MKKISRLLLPVVLSGLLISCSTPQTMQIVPTLGPEVAAPIDAAINLPLEVEKIQIDAEIAAVHERNLVLEFEPINLVGTVGSWDAQAVDPGGMIEINGTYHMFYNALPGDGWVAMGYATSTDGKTWARASDEYILRASDIPWETPQKSLRVTSALYHDDQWVIYFTASAQPRTTGADSIGRATAPTPFGPWDIDPQPVLPKGERGQWDAGGVGFAKVLPYDDGFVMYYTTASALGMAFSSDGVTWEKYNDPTTDGRYAQSDPLLQVKVTLEDASVQRLGKRWVMTMRQNDGIYYATSTDGREWKVDPTPIVPSVPGRVLWYSALSVIDGKATLFYEAGDFATRIYRATWDEPH